MFMHYYVVGLEPRGLILGMTTIFKAVSTAPPVEGFSSNFTGLVSDRSRCACQGILHSNFFLKKRKFVSMFMLSANFGFDRQ